MKFPECVFAAFRVRRSVRCGVLAAGLLATAFARADDAPITEVATFWDLPADQRSHEFNVQIEFRVGFYDPNWNVMWGESRGLTFWVHPGDKPFPIRTGQRIRVTGKMTPLNGFSLANTRVEVLQASEPLTPLPATGLLDNVERFQSHTVAVEGYIQRAVVVDSRHVMLELLSGGTIAQCRILVPQADGTALARLEDARVRVTGVYVAQMAQAGNIAALAIWIDGLENVAVIGSLATDPRFKLEASPIEKLPYLIADRPVLVTGYVHASEPGKSVTLRDHTGQVTLFSPQTRPLRIGTVVDAVGYPSVQGYAWTLRDGLFRQREHDNATIPDPLPGEKETLRLADQVLELRPEEAARGRPVKLYGVVTWTRGSSDFLYLQDPTSGIRINLGDQIRSSREMLYGVIEITGVTEPGHFAPQVLAKTLTRIGQTTFPPPRTITLEQAMTGIEEGQWVEMRGLLRQVHQGGTWTQLSLTSPSGEFVARLPRNDDVSNLVGSTVRITGVCLAEANERRELASITLLAPNSESIQVEDPAPADPFSVPLRTIASLRQYSPIQASNRRVRILGQVVHHAPGHHVRIQDGDAGLLALSRDTTPLLPGDNIELVGFPGRDGARVVLREATYRRLAPGREPAPTALTSPERIDPDLDSRLVSIEGTLLESTRRGGEHLFIVQTREALIQALLDNDDDKTIPAPAIGARVRLTGVYQVQFDEYRHGDEFHLRLRTPADITVLSAPSWWTARRALAAAALLLACVLVVTVWLASLRRRVALQTRLLREQFEKEALLQARHREIVDNASDFIFTTDLKGRFTSFNPAGERITGYTARDALRLNLRDLIAPDDRATPLPLLDTPPAKDGAVTFQLRFKTLDGRLIWIETNARLVRNAGQPASILGVARDVSERKAIEEELRRARDAAETNTRAKSAFLANMSHEIRTPMNGVIGMSNLLLDTALSDEQRDFSETIRNSAEALLTVLNDILDFSKIEAGKLSFEVIDFDLAEAVESTLELMAGRASTKGLELASFLPQELPRLVRGDPGRLRQVLLNLIGNAIKFTEKGEVVVAVALEQDNTSDVRIHFEVTDTGLGMSPETQERLFQPFSQADSSTTRKFGGTGLGLAISKQIVQLMDGQIGVRSSPDSGSTFWFSVRLEKQPFDTPQEKPVQITALNGLRALIVDDNATNRKILQHYSVSWGLRSEPVASAAEALTLMRAAAANHDPFQLVMLDYQMPVTDGLMLAREIQTDARIAGARMVLLTSWDRRFSREELTEAGIVRMLVKPIRQQDLLGALLRCMRIGHGTNPGFPVHPQRDQPVPVEPKSRHAPPGARTLRILIAEDNAVNQRVALLQLQNLGHTADHAINGVEVLSVLESRSYDVILMDGQMPEMDGYETTRRIRQNPKHNSLWIIAMTANAMQGDRERCIEAGMDDYISKPTRVEDLRNALARCPAMSAPAH